MERACLQLALSRNPRCERSHWSNPRCERSHWSVGPAALDRSLIGQWDTTLVQLPVGFGEHPGRKRGKPTRSGIEPGSSKPRHTEQHTPKTS